MEKFTGKTLEDALNQASEAFGVSIDDITYTVTFEKKTLFTKRVEIEAYCVKSIQTMIETYLMTVLTDMGFEAEVSTSLVDGRIMVDINTNNNSILIGKGGQILQSLNTIVKTAVSNTFKKRVELSVDINNYKQERYKKVEKMAIRLGRNVQRNRVDVKLDPMPADERKVVHQALTKMNYVRTESFGEGRQRYLTIIYDASKYKEKKVETEETSEA